MPSTPLMACSSGVVTADSTVCALAPVYTLVTVTCGGASCGYCAMGSRGMHTAPAITMNSEHTVANTGRLMKKSTNTPQAPVVDRQPSAVDASLHHRHRRTICQVLCSRNNHLVTGL